VNARRRLSWGLEKFEERRLLAGFAVTESDGGTMVGEGGDGDTLTVALTAQPESDVVLRLTSEDATEFVVHPSVLTFTPADWASPQTVSVVGVDDPLIDGPQTTRVTVSVDDEFSDDAFAGLEPQTVRVTNVDDDAAWLKLSKTAATVSGSGTTDTFTVVLTAQPDADVVLTVTSADSGEVSVSPASLTFTPADWHLPQTVTLTGVDDGLIDGSQWTTVTVAVENSLSDFHFAGLAEFVGVTTADDDLAGFVLSKTAANVHEDGATDTFTVRLTAQPDTNVTLTALSGDSGEATVSPTVLTFTPADWNWPQTMTITGVDDPLIDGNQETWVTVSVADDFSDDNFDAVGDQTVTVLTADDDVAGFTVSPAAVIVSESGASDTFTVVLTAQPVTDVVLTVTSGDTGEATAGPAALTFTPDDWHSPQAVTVTGVDDSDRDGSQVTPVTVAVDEARSDDQFSGVGSQAVSVTTYDDDITWRNAENPFDVDGNGRVDAADVLMIINYLNGHSGNPALPPPPAGPPAYYDVNGDGLCTAADVLAVINWINTHGVSYTSGGEGEDASRGWRAAAAVRTIAPTEPMRPASGNESLALASSDAPALAPRSPLARETGDRRLSGARTRLAHLVSGGRRQAADAVFEVWPDSPARDLADTLLPDLSRVSS